MLGQPRKNARLVSALCALALPLLLAQCGNTGDSANGASAGASGAAGHGGAAAAGASGTAGYSGTATASGGAGTAGAATSEGGGAGAQHGDDAAGDSGAGSPATDAGAGGVLNGAAGSADCGVESTTYTSPTAQHVVECSVIDYPMNPPVYGDHYPRWAAYKSYSFPVPLGFLVHNLEHGAIVFLYHCADGCADEVAAAQAFIDALPTDPRCIDPVKHQVILSPDPTLPTRWGAIAWGHSLRTDCFSAPTFRTFYDENLAHGGEDTCGDGADLAADICQ